MRLGWELATAGGLGSALASRWLQQSSKEHQPWALNKKASVSFGNLPKMKCSHLCPWLGGAGGSHGHW